MNSKVLFAGRFAAIFCVLVGMTFLRADGRAQGIPEPDQRVYGTVFNTQGGQNVRLTSGTLVWTFRPLPNGTPVSITTQLTNFYDQFSFLLTVPCESQVGVLVASSNVLKIVSPPINYDRSTITLDGQPVYLKLPLQSTLSMSGTSRGRFEQVDLVLSRDEQDSDGDGLPDWWERIYFGSISSANPNADLDHDGESNLAEYKAGTDPNDPTSRFAFINVRPDVAGGISVEWSSSSNRVYLLQRSSNLLGGFVDIKTDINATAPVNFYHDATATGFGPYFYRLQLQENFPSPVDADGNGLADEWERLYFGRIRANPSLDADQDGLTNLAEFKAGTNPLQSTSVLKFINIRQGQQGGVVLEWASVVNKRYEILRSRDPRVGFEVIANDVEGTPPVNVFGDDKLGISPQFYRIRVMQ